MAETVAPIPDSPADQDSAAEVRKIIETIADEGETVLLQKGKFSIDRALWARPGKPLVIIGSGPETVLANEYTSSPYLMNQTVTAYGDGFGYLDGIAHPGARPSTTLQLLDQSQWPNFNKPGRVAYAHGYDNRTGVMFCQRLTLEGCSTSGLVSFRGAAKIPEFVSQPFLKWTDAEPVAEVGVGAHFLTLENDTVYPWAAGTQVLISGGPCKSGYEFPSEWRKVVSVEGRTLHLDFPVGRTYQGACVLIAQSALLRLENLTLGGNPTQYTDSMFCKLAQADLRNVTSLRGGTLCTCGPSSVLDCRFADFLSQNSSDRIRTVGGYFGSVMLEEAVYGSEFERVSVGPGSPNGFYTSTYDNEAVRMTDCEVATWPAVNYGMPLAFGGTDFVIRNLAVRSGNMCVLFGDRLRAEGVSAPGRLVFCNGKDMILSGIRSPDIRLGWIQDSGSGGQLLGSYGTVTKHNDFWVVIPGG